jgi:hypothetical protein
LYVSPGFIACSMAKSKYNSDFPQLAEMYLREGMTELQAAKRLGVSKTTFEQYKVQFPDFLAAIKKGKAPVDFEVENALLKRALGYTYTERKEEMAEIDTGEGVQPVPGKKVTETIKEVAPDVTAQIFWLKNRQPHRWRDVKGVELTGKDGGPVRQEQNITAPEVAQAVKDLAASFL